MKNNLIYYNLYATYDRVANTIGLPFTAQNNNVALRKLKNLKEQMEKEGIKETEDISVMYLGQYTMTPIKIKDVKGSVVAFEPIFIDIDNAYDICDCFDRSRERESGEQEATENYFNYQGGGKSL